MKPLLVLDCFLDPAGGARHYTRWLRGRPVEVIRPTVEPVSLSVTRWSGLVISGSAACLPDGNVPWAEGVLDLVRAAAAAALPTLGICFGHQVIAEAIAGPGSVRKAAAPEIGFLPIEVLVPDDPVLGPLAPSFDVFVSHEDEVVDDLPGLVTLARSAACASHALRVVDCPMWGVQFHAEMDLDEQRKTLTYRARKHPGLGIDVEAQLARSATLPELAPRLFDAWLAQVDAAR